MGEISRNEDEWQRRAMEQAITGARQMIMGNSKQIPSVKPIGTLTDQQWGFIVTQIIFEWITVRCEQAATENIGMEAAARQWPPGAPRPCDVGAIKAILPRLAGLPVDWTKPLNDWSRDTMLMFLTAAHEMICEAVAARDLGPDGILRYRKSSGVKP
jgi:hypothetical protein